MNHTYVFLECRTITILRSHKTRTRRRNFILAVESNDTNAGSSKDMIYPPTKKGARFLFDPADSFSSPPPRTILGFGVPVVSRSKDASRQFGVSEAQGSRRRLVPMLYTTFRGVSSQPSSVDDKGGAGTEDCLEVNVYTPLLVRNRILNHTSIIHDILGDPLKNVF